MQAPTHPDAVAPERTRFVDSRGVRIHVHEWGDPTAPPVVMAHGMFDHGRGFDRLAPHLADRFRVVSIDARGHGDSDWADAYLWTLDVLDLVNVLRDLGRPAHLVGHSKGGGQATDAALAAPSLVRKLVNIDGFGPPDDAGFQRPGGPDLSSLPVAQRCRIYLDRRRGAHERDSWRPYASLDELVERRAQQNPLLSKEWLRYFVYHGARETEEGWVWKSDPQMAAGGFGPFKPAWIAPRWAYLACPMLAVIGSLPDTWGPLPEDVLAPRLAYVPQLERATIEGAGHFVQMERPVELAAVLREFLEP